MDWRFNIAGRPALDVVQTFFLLVAVIYLVRNWRKAEGWTLVIWVIVGWMILVLVAILAHLIYTLCKVLGGTTWSAVDRYIDETFTLTDPVLARRLAERDVTYAVFSSGPLYELVAYRDFMGWTTPWYSTADSGDVLATRNGGDVRCYLRAGDEVFETYETKWRGIEPMMPTLQLLDLTPYGRQETWEDSPVGWPQDQAGSWWRRSLGRGSEASEAVDDGPDGDARGLEHAER